LAPRQLARLALAAVLRRKQPFDESFNALAASRYPGIQPRDRAFARLLSVTVLRRWGQITAILETCLDKALPADAFDTDLALRIGIAQLAFMEAAPHAAIDLAVADVKGIRRQDRYSGLVNAVLRRILRERSELLASAASVRNTPPWLYERWKAHFGHDRAAALDNAHSQEPPLDLSVKADAEGWARRLQGLALPWGTVRLKGAGRVDALDGFDEGAWWVQDAAAALPVLMLGDVNGKRVADLCAAPGGKTAQLAAGGAHVTAVDMSANRLRRVAENLDRLHLAANVICADASSWDGDGRLFDAILLDAPCSATGTIRRHPDIPFLKSETDIAALAAVQNRLLQNAIKLLNPGGILVYATCSLEPEEGERQIENVVAEGADAELDPFPADVWAKLRDYVTGAPFASQEEPPSMLRTFPFWLDLGEGQSGMDGFFMARLRRKS
jgi:16S rRNA (cytosine967-C5)-methyltransferase